MQEKVLAMLYKAETASQYEAYKKGGRGQTTLRGNAQHARMHEVALQ